MGGCQEGKRDMWEVVKGDFRHFHTDLLQDCNNLIHDPVNLGVLAVGGAASGYVRFAHDDEIEDHFEINGHYANDRTFSRDFSIAVGAVPLTEMSLMGVGYIGGLVGENDKLRKVSHNLIEAQTLNVILTNLLKVAAQDESPNGENLAWPSGHTSTAVTFAAVLQEHYGWWVGLPLYALSGFVMYERMETGEHWASDVIFGAALGYTVGRTVAKGHKPEIFGMEVVPFIDPQMQVAGLSLSKRF